MVGVLDSMVIPDDLLTIEQALSDFNADLIVIDTLSDFVNCNVLGNQAVRKALLPLRELADDTNTAVVAIRHLVKAGGGHSLLRGGGSVAITAMARSQLKLFPHPEDKHMRVLVQDKSNLGQLSPSLTFEVVSTDNGAFRLDWHGECDYTAEELGRADRGKPKLEAAMALLLRLLKDGPMNVNTILAEAKGVCSKRTLDEAKKELGVITERKGSGKGHKVYWALPTHCSDDDCNE